MSTIAVDWDNTLYADGEWLPDAQRALKVLKRRGHKIVIHSCRARDEGGADFIRGILKDARYDFPVTAIKPDADVYLDDRAMKFDGDWSKTLSLLRSR